MEEKNSRYRWLAAGDINGFFGLMFDNVTVLAFLAFILTVIFQYPAEIVYKKMFPGTAFGVLFGDMVYTWMAFRLAKRTNNPTVTAMPLGLDTPSTIGIAFTVLGPCFIALKAKGMAPDQAAMMTWYVGMATMILIGAVKLVLSFVGGWVQKIVPQAGLLGSLAGIGLALIGFLPLVDIFGIPVAGFVSLGIILYNLVAGIRLPKSFPGVLAAIVIGTGIYYIFAPMGVMGGIYKPPTAEFHLGFPLPTLNFIHGFMDALQYLPIAIPFAVLTVVGGINVTESARVAGDDFKTRDILLTEAVSTLVAGLCGGVAQSTPYIGQPAYKAMGSRAGYTLFTGLFIGFGGVLGYVSFIVELIPKAVLAPILIFVALDIMCQAFLACPARHAPAVAFAYFPTIARVIYLKMSGVVGAIQEILIKKGLVTFDQFTQLVAPALTAITEKSLPDMLVVTALGNGFILTAMLWGAFMVMMIERKLKMSALYLAILALFTFFGIIHSATPDGNMYAPWTLAEPLVRVPYQFTAAYLVMAAMMFLLSFTRESKEPPPAEPLGGGH